MGIQDCNVDGIFMCYTAILIYCSISIAARNHQNNSCLMHLLGALVLVDQHPRTDQLEAPNGGRIE